MDAQSRWPLTEGMRAELIEKISANLQLLRVKMGISQEELAKIIGISRQTYSVFESGRRTMSWQVFLSLVLFFDVNPATHDLLHHLGCFPDILIDNIDQDHKSGNPAKTDYEQNADILEMLSKIDDQALRSIRTMLMVEYARCTNTPGEEVVKAFDGSNFRSVGKADSEIQSALNRIRTRSEKNEKE